MQRLGEGRPLVHDGFLGTARAVACARAVRAVARAGHLTPARVGPDRGHFPDVRGDHTAWFSELALPAPLVALAAAFEALRQGLQQHARLALPGFELQLASYPGDGARYALHRDAFRGDPRRRITAICYLNPDWEAAHGGRLRCVGTAGEEWIEPRLDRLVIFLSDALQHEVEPCFAPRFAVTAWYRGPEP